MAYLDENWGNNLEKIKKLVKEYESTMMGCWYNLGEAMDKGIHVDDAKKAYLSAYDDYYLVASACLNAAALSSENKINDNFVDYSLIIKEPYRKICELIKGIKEPGEIEQFLSYVKNLSELIKKEHMDETNEAARKNFENLLEQIMLLKKEIQEADALADEKRVSINQFVNLDINESIGGLSKRELREELVGEYKSCVDESDNYKNVIKSIYEAVSDVLMIRRAKGVITIDAARKNYEIRKTVHSRIDETTYINTFLTCVMLSVEMLEELKASIYGEAKLSKRKGLFRLGKKRDN